MPTFVDPSKCDGCKGGEKTACMYICPNDLMILDPDAMKAYNQEPDACWECYSCVKICPQGAITARPYADFAPMGGTCIPMRSAPEGSIKPFAGWDDKGSLDDELFYTEKKLMEPQSPMMKKAEVSEADKTLTF